MQPTLVSSGEGHEHFILSLAYSSDSCTIASGGADDIIRLWDAKNGLCLDELRGHTDYVQAVAFSPVDRDLLVSSGRDGKILLWSLSDRKLKNVVIKGHDAAVRSFSFNSDGQFLASCSGAQNSSEKQDNTVRVWNISSGMQILLLRFHTATIHSVTWHPETQVLATASRDRIVGVHTLGRELITSSKSLRGHTDYVNAVAWSPCGTALASASSDRSVRIWHSSSGEILQVQALCSF